MLQDKQLGSVKLEEVVQKRRLGQALNAKEFAVLAGISYSAAREWFRLPGFPVFRGVVFWQDFALWRSAQTGLRNLKENTPPNGGGDGAAPECSKNYSPNCTALHPRVAKILAEAGGKPHVVRGSIPLE